ncbi:hypothetical protein [Paenibacillus pini]|uniref:Zinc-ribbon domain-containing protein n=1 Tax=Paenibacillus pini JCM 16418 TaxID=1236976 RepID=W7YMC8_9BACL|nr:hypothetical protein [Paenibacillus pini]GAF09587.1 hypothetical protein JCM16418_3733 [Paenibacillus pini JCM 16418]
MMDQIHRLQDEIEYNLNQINHATDEKQCTCGQVVPVGARFCPVCGKPFIEIERREEL